MAEQRQVQSVPETKQVHRAWSFYLITVAGIPIFLHFTFVLMILFLSVMEFRTGQPMLGGVLFILAIFASVGLHELGHALVAKRFGIKTDDIVLYPIGGVARLRSMGEGFQEFWIAIAGPLVNVVIAVGLGAYLMATNKWVPLEKVTQSGVEVHFLQRVMFANIVLIIFNMIPAFPMDGGRVLRALLARTMAKARATAVAARIGQAFAIFFMISGLMSGQILLTVIGAFVFVAAGQESAATRSAALLAGKRARDAMITHFEYLAHGDSLGHAAELLLSTTQQDFPVLSGSEVLGVLDRKALVQGLATHGRDHYVAEVMERKFPRMTPDEELQHAYEKMRDGQGSAIMVMEGERLVGYINGENLMEYLLIQQTQTTAAAAASVAAH